MTPSLTCTTSADEARFAAAGPWIAVHANALERLADGTLRGANGARRIVVDIAAVEELDTFGAWLLERLIRRCEAQGLAAALAGVPVRYRGLLDEVRQTNRGKPESRARDNAVFTALETIGRALAKFLDDLGSFASMLGALIAALLRVLVRPKSFRFTSAVHHLYRIGWQALPIMILITFLIGCIIAQQGIFHFRKFGADVYVVDLLGILVLREIGVLLIAIMVAGRSGSSYTAELGSMKMREEIDALRTMGLDPVEVLLLPRVLALVIALPILTFVGSMAALYGGGLVAWLYGGMSPEIFIERLRDAVSVTHFKVGMIKAPFMALVIGIVACSEGLKVKGSAESLGLQTTTSVVKSIFMVIVLDGLFAVFFASIGM